MATIEKRGPFWRVKIRRTGLPAQTRTFDSKTLAQQWARGRRIRNRQSDGRRSASRAAALARGDPGSGTGAR